MKKGSLRRKNLVEPGMNTTLRERSSGESVKSLCDRYAIQSETTFESEVK